VLNGRVREKPTDTASDSRAAATEIRRALQAARPQVRDGALELDLDCPAANCPVAHLRIHVQETAARLGGALRCVACGSQLIARSVLPAEEANALHEQWARSSVNVQLYIARERARLGEPGADIDVPTEVRLDTRLPGGLVGLA
jgi:hypothetical protein